MSGPTSAGGAAESVSWEMRGPDGELITTSDDTSESKQRDEEDHDDH